MVTQGSGRKADHMGEHSAGRDPAAPDEPGPNETTWVFSSPGADLDPAATWRPPSAGPRHGASPSGSVGPPPGETFQDPLPEAPYYPDAEMAAPPRTETSGYSAPAAPPWGDMTGYPEAPVERPRAELSGYPQAQTVPPRPELSGYPPAPPVPPRTELSGYPPAPPRTELSGYPPAPPVPPRTELSGYPEAAVERQRADVAQPPPSGYLRYGPGVPAMAAAPASAAEQIWRTGPVPEPPRRRPRWRRALASGFTVLLLAVAAVILFLRFHHPAFAVTGASITQQTRNGCGVDVTGQIATSGGAGTVSYQWVFRPDTRPPQPLTQTVIAGQKAVFVTVAVEGSGSGSAAQSVTLQVLGPDKRAASTSVVVRC
jgi:hypothetical protein